MSIPDPPSSFGVTDADVEAVNTELAGSAYWNRDIAPVKPSRRTWGIRDMAVLWIALSACITTYMLASSLIDGGMNWWQAVLTVFIANIIVLIPMILNAHAGTKYGIPFPVYCRASFGVRGANVPAILRALVACGWFGIQTWIGGKALYMILELYFVDLAKSHALPGLGINPAQLLCFLIFWGLNVYIVYRGVESIRFLLNMKAPFLLFLGVALLGWAYYEAGGVGPIFAQESEFIEGGKKAGQFWAFFFPALTANIGYWATLALNIPDFSRYARSQKAQMLGQAIGLPPAMGLFAFIGVFVTSATVLIYNHREWDPVNLLARFQNPGAHLLGLFALVVATLATNIAANVVGPANDIANLWPQRISFRIGGIITGIIGLLMQPWRLIETSDVYIERWLIAYSSLLGAIGGILIVDYFLIRRTRLDLRSLYARDGNYWYKGGFHLPALIALVLGIAPCVPGFLSAVKIAEVPRFWAELYHYAWFVSFGIAGVVYFTLTKLERQPTTAE